MLLHFLYRFQWGKQDLQKKRKKQLVEATDSICNAKESVENKSAIYWQSKEETAPRPQNEHVSAVCQKLSARFEK